MHRYLRHTCDVWRENRKVYRAHARMWRKYLAGLGYAAEGPRVWHYWRDHQRRRQAWLDRATWEAQ